MKLNAITAGMLQAASLWIRPDAFSVTSDYRKEFTIRCDSLNQFIKGEAIRLIARDQGISRTTLTSTIEKAFSEGAHGAMNGYLACIPYNIRTRSTEESEYPSRGGPHAVTKMVSRYPEVAKILQGVKGSLTGGKLPPAFTRAVRDVHAFLKEKGHADEWPFSLPDKGRREFARWLRKKRRRDVDRGRPSSETLPAPSITRLDDIFALDPFDITQFDEHFQDTNFVLRVPHAENDYADVGISQVWLLLEVETKSTANMTWRLVFGTFSNLDIAQCLSKSLIPWTPRHLVVEDMHYKPGSCMPSNLPFGPTRGRMIAIDNHKAHKKIVFVTTYAMNIDGIVNFGPRYRATRRPHIEGKFGFFEQAALRLLPGGFEPAKGEEGKKAISHHRAEHHPVHIQALEDVIDILVTEDNVAQRPAKQQRSPMDILLAYRESPSFWLPSLQSNDAFKVLTSEVRIVTFRGTKKKDKNKPVHINLFHVTYRCPSLDNEWDLIGQSYRALVDLEDLRTITLLNDKSAPFATLTAARPWHRTQHDLVTRRRIFALARKGQIDLEATECAIAAYAKFTLANAANNKTYADQTARLIQMIQHGKMESSADASQDAMSTAHGRRAPFRFDSTD